MSSRCKSCNAPIIWAQNESTGRAMPIDADPVDGGNVLILDPEPDGIWFRVLNKEEVAKMQEPLHTSHFQTCPNAGEWRAK